MDSYFKITYLDSGKLFASIISSKSKVSILGSSDEGIYWAKWATQHFPLSDSSNMDQLLQGIGLHLKVEGPTALTRQIKEKFDALVLSSADKPTQDKIVKDDIVDSNEDG